MDERMRKDLLAEATVPVWSTDDSRTTAARVLNESRDATYGQIKRGHIPSVRIGRTLRVPTTWLRKVVGIDQPEAA